MMYHLRHHQLGRSVYRATIKRASLHVPSLALLSSLLFSVDDVKKHHQTTTTTTTTLSRRCFASSSSLSSSLSVSVTNQGQAVTFMNSNNSLMKQSTTIIPASWLWVNDPCSIHSTSGQRLRTLAEYGGGINRILEATIVDTDDDIVVSDDNSNDIHYPSPPKGSFHSIGGIYDSDNKDSDGGATTSSSSRQYLQIKWKSKNNNTTTSQRISHFDLHWLNSFWSFSVETYKKLLEIKPKDALGNMNNNNHHTKSIQRFDYHHIMADDNNDKKNDQIFHLLHAIVQDGAALIESTPHYENDDNNEESPVARVGKLLGGGTLSHTTLYGETFHVQSIPDAHNIAYTSHALPPHQDLSYYESMPGLQLLHCIYNCNNSGGGESTLLDAMAAAYEFRNMEPTLFDILTKTFVTFCKQRHGAELWYQRPHIVLDSNNELIITTVNWSPPFEGPLILQQQNDTNNNKTTFDLHQEYKLAYTAFSCMIDNQLDNIDLTWLQDELSKTRVQALIDYSNQYTWEYKLKPGEMLIFSNRRMLHGRRSFQLQGNDDQRHLMGTYTNLDDTMSLYRTLLRERRQQGEDVTTIIPNVGNGSRGTVL